MAKRSKSWLREFREALRMNQGQFARALGVAQSLVSACERGGKEPSSEFYGRVGNVAARAQLYDIALRLYQDAGMELARLLPVLVGAEEKLSAHAKRGEIRRVDPSERIAAEDRTGSLPLRLPRSMVPNPLAAAYVRIHDDKMEPMFKRGDVLVVEELKTDLWELEGLWVAFYRRPLSPGEAIKSPTKKKAPLSNEEHSAEKGGFRPECGLLVGVICKEIRAGMSILVLRTLQGASRDGTRWDILAFDSSAGARREETFQLPGWTTVGRVVAWIAEKSARGLAPQKPQRKQKRK